LFPCSFVFEFFQQTSAVTLLEQGHHLSAFGNSIFEVAIQLLKRGLNMLFSSKSESVVQSHLLPYIFKLIDIVMARWSPAAADSINTRISSEFLDQLIQLQSATNQVRI
jgi:hypothetical protein